MCGILCTITCGDVAAAPINKCGECLSRRGPDGQSYFTKHIKLDSNPDAEGTVNQKDICVDLYGYTLQLQGPLTLQPMTDPDGNMLLWNGEIFEVAKDLKVDRDENDGLVLLQHLTSCTSDEDVISEMSKVKGPWSFIYWKDSTHSLFFGRDFFGRRSLLWQFKGGDSTTFSLSSVAKRHLLPEEAWLEVPARGIYKLCADTLSSSSSSVTTLLFPWQKHFSRIGTSNEPTSVQETVLASESDHQSFVQNVQDVFIPVTIEPLNKLILKEHVLTKPEAASKVSLDEDPELKRAAEQLVQVLAEAVRRRVQNVPLRRVKMKSVIRAEVRERGEDVLLEGEMDIEGGMSAEQTNPASIAILFSGGIDSMVLAALADRFIPAEEPIDLLNVAFQQKEKPNNPRGWDPFAVPDRITGRSGLQELQTLNPQRRWNFVEINVTVTELQEARRNRIGDLVYPLESVLDDSIGCAMWFAARGEGVRYPTGDGEDEQHYISMSKVVLSGLGADEQLAGYSRHRTHFKRGGWEALLSQLEMELARIPSRNLGRDDRIISDHGREARFPYLDEDVVSYLNGLPIHLKADLTLPRGEGEKLLLRVAARQIGLTGSSRLPKRAIQFGSKIAKLEDSTHKGSDISTSLKLDVENKTLL